MKGVKLGRWSLRLDAAYCLLVGAGLAVASGTLAGPAGVPSWVLLAAGAATAAWGALLTWLPSRVPLRRALRLVMLVNIVTAAALAVSSAALAGLFVTLGALAIAVDVAAFAVSQGVALRGMRGTGTA